jgi:multisubunit Na+/H+ antiporter MnhB subunit
MDPNRWPALVWLVVALGFGSVLVSLVLFLFSAAFRRKRPGWLLDAALLGFSGFVLVAVMASYIVISQGRLTKEWQRVFGPPIVMVLGLALAGLSARVLRRAFSSKKMRKFGSAKGEFTVPDDFNDPLPKEIEDLFYK